MDLEQYLKEMETCKYPKMLKEVFGVHNNCEILLGIDAYTLASDLINSGHFYFNGSNQSSGDIYLNFRPGTTYLQIYDGLSDLVLDRFSEDERQEIKRKFRAEVTLHPYQGGEFIPGKKIEGVQGNNEALAKVIVSICRYILKEEIPAIFPRTMGCPRDRSKLLWYEKTK